MYVLNLEKDTSRVLSAGEVFNGCSISGGILVESLPDDGKTNLYDYLYINGEFVYSPIELKEEVTNL